MRRLITILLTAFVCTSAFPAKCLEITLTSGTKIYYSFDKYIPLIRFVDGAMRVSARKFEFGNIERFAVIEDPTGIPALQARPDFSVDGNLLTVASLEPLRVYNMQGQPQPVSVTAGDEAQYVDLGSLSRGVYVVHVGGQSFTIYKN